MSRVQWRGYFWRICLGIASVQMSLLLPISALALPSSGSQASAGCDGRVVERIRQLWSKASLIYKRAHSQSGAQRLDETDSRSATLKAIETQGPRAWTKAKIQQVSSLAGIKDSKFKALIADYVDRLADPRPQGSKTNGQPLDPSARDAEEEAISFAVEQQLQAIPNSLKERFLQLISPVFKLTRGALTEVMVATTETGELTDQVRTPPSTRRIAGQAYYDDIDSLFEDTRSQIDKNFCQFTDGTAPDGISQKLLNTPVQAQDMTSNMRQASSSAVQQVGQYKSGLQQLENMITPATK